MNKKKSKLPLRHVDGRWMYDEVRLREIFKKMSQKRQNVILTKAIDVLVQRPGIAKWSAIAYALGCSYDDAMFWYKKTQIRS